MSFDINGPGPTRKPVIREAQSMENNGGGGNLGYMQSRKKKKNEDEFESELQIIEDDMPNSDSFNKNDKEELKENKPSIFDKIKNFLNPEKDNS